MFTPVESALGAVLLQQASTTLLFSNGCVLGASGQLRGILTRPTSKSVAFIAGMALSVFATKTMFPMLIPDYAVPRQDWNDSLWILGVGVLTGYGTKVRLQNRAPLTYLHVKTRLTIPPIELQRLHFRTYAMWPWPPLSSIVDCHAHLYDRRLYYPQVFGAISYGQFIYKLSRGC